MDAPTEPAQSARAALVDQLKKPGSLALVFLGIVLALASNLSLPELKLPIIWPVTICILWLAYIWISTATLRDQVGIAQTLKRHIVDLEAQPNLQLPKVAKAMLSPGSDNELMLLLRPNKLFGQSMSVSIYFEDERGLELLVANGVVANIQMNGLIQIIVSEWQEPHSNVRQKIIEQDQSAIDRIIVKPASSLVNSQTDANAILLNYLINRTSGGNQI